MFIEEGIDNHYQDIEKIGEGGFGTVFRAVSRLNGEVSPPPTHHDQFHKTVNRYVFAPQTVAIKRVALDNGGPVKMLARQEVNLLSKIQHPNIVGYKGCHFTQAQCYLVMEFCAGGDLLDIMQSLQDFR
jgi:serine/threonine protein kinase